MPILPLHPQDAAKYICGTLPARRMRDVLERRFGLKGGHKATLEEIGAIYKITRERVRQIEADAIRRVARPENLSYMDPLLNTISEDLSLRGEVVSSAPLFEALAERRAHPHLHFLLSLAPAFSFLPETDEFHPRWTINVSTATLAEETMCETARVLETYGYPIGQDALMEIVARAAEGVFHRPVAQAHLETYAATSKVIRQNPYGEFGLVSWPAVTPRGIKDKAYTAFRHHAHPAHFLEVARLIDQGGWSRKKVHPQTVHNELIKDSRFVLVGRGLYALREWGYEEGSVREVITSLLKAAKNPLTRDEIISMASTKRMVKPQTILLNLQNRDLFRKTEDGKYTLV